MMTIMWVRAGLQLLVLAGCASPTQLLVIVDSDLAELATVDVTASTDGSFAESRRFDVATTGLPFSFGVAAEREARVRVGATGLAADGTTLVAHTVETRFLAGRTLRLEIPLARACILEPSCEDMDLRCVHGDCVDPRVDPATLDEGTGPPSPLFAGVTDPPDAGPPPLADGGCVSGAACADPANPCRVGRTICDGDVPGCAIAETLPEGADCGEGRTCDGSGQCGR